MLSSCKEKPAVRNKTQVTKITISDSITPVDSISTFIAPYRERVNTVLDLPLAYAPAVISKSDGTLNTSAGNLLADIILHKGNPIFNARTGKQIDVALINHGGIRAIISKGNVTARTAYEVMPFENTIQIASLKGTAIRSLISYLIAADQPHGIAGMQITLDPDKKLNAVNINGKPFDEDRIYYVATSNYLLNGGDNMGFFSESLEIHETEYLIRNAIIDHFKAVDTIHAKVDDRFIQLPN